MSLVAVGSSDIKLIDLSVLDIKFFKYEHK